MQLAVIKTGGKQYVVKPGQKLKVEKLDAEVGNILKLPALLTADGEKTDIGTPDLSATVNAKVLAQGRGDKISIVKFKSKVRYRRKRGHRQAFTQVEIQ